MLKPKVGDTVTLKPMKVIGVHNGGANIVMSVDGIPARAQVSLPHIASIEPRPLQVGDRVYINTACTQPGDGYPVEFISDRIVLSYNGSLLARTYTPADLTRVEDKP